MDFYLLESSITKKQHFFPPPILCFCEVTAKQGTVWVIGEKDHIQNS